MEVWPVRQLWQAMTGMIVQLSIKNIVGYTMALRRCSSVRVSAHFLILWLASTSVVLGVAPVGALAQDVEAGKRVFARCSPCHNVDKQEAKVGPTLLGLMGRTAGTVPGFAYSQANKNSNTTWTTETLNQYLIDPKAMMPGTKMVFPGIKNEKERADLIAYLSNATKPN